MTPAHRSVRPTAVAALGAALLAAAALTGCGSASGEDHLAILEQEPAEPVPGYVNALGILKPGTARLLGTVDGTEYYVGEELATRGVVCLVPVSTEEPETDWGAACSTESDQVIVVHEGLHGEAALVADTAGEATLDQLAEEGWREVSQNLWVR